MIYFVIFSIYSILIMGFVVLSYVLWVKRTFKETPVGFTVKFKLLRGTFYGQVIGHTQSEYLLRCGRGLRYRWVSKDLCKPCWWKNFP